MNIRKIALCAASALVALVSIAQAQSNNIAEEVAWMIGDRPLWKSEIEETYQQMLAERMPISGNPYCAIPEQLAIERLYLHQAELDTVEVQPSMIASQVDSRINAWISSAGSQEKLEEYMHKSLPEIRSWMSEMMTNNYKVEQVQRSLTGDIKPTPNDVRRYFTSLSEDSIPFVPQQVEVQIITLNPAIPRQEIEDVKARLRDYSDRVTRGESEFSTLAVLYSEDGSAIYGGELGFMGRAQMVPEFAAVAFNLNDPKKVSKIVETEYGFHIIQLIEKRGDRVNCRHILLRPKVAEKDLTDAVNRLDSIKADIDSAKFSFEDAATFISQDKDTRNSRGVMVNSKTGTTRFEMSHLPAEIARVVNGMQPGDVSRAFIMKDPKRNSDIVAIVKLTARIDAHKANLSDDYQQIKGMYEQARKQEILREWVEKKIAETYVRIEDGWRDCEFKHSGWIKNAN